MKIEIGIIAVDKITGKVHPGAEYTGGAKVYTSKKWLLMR